MFHALAESNQKKESDRIDLLGWLVERLPLVMIDDDTLHVDRWRLVGCCVRDVSILFWHICRPSDGHHCLWLAGQRISDLQKSY